MLPRIPAEFWEDGIAIIVNDKSPDETGEVAESLQKRSGPGFTLSITKSIEAMVELRKPASDEDSNWVRTPSRSCTLTVNTRPRSFSI